MKEIKLLCVKNETLFGSLLVKEDLIIGKIYEGVIYEEFDDSICIMVVNEKNKKILYGKKFFEPLAEWRDKRIDLILDDE